MDPLLVYVTNHTKQLTNYSVNYFGYTVHCMHTKFNLLEHRKGDSNRNVFLYFSTKFTALFSRAAINF